MSARRSSAPAIGGVEARWTVIPNGVDTERRQKGGEDVLLAEWEPVPGRLPNACLVLVGDGPDGEELRANAPASVRFARRRAGPGALVPGGRSRRPAVPLGGDGADATGRDGLRPGRSSSPMSTGRAKAMPPGHAPFCPTPSQDPYAALATAVADLLLNAPLRATLGRQGQRHVTSGDCGRRPVPPSRPTAPERTG
ncbi:hypothetical protein HRW23_03605 [Streptomyces lunaelactis]|nr:hypothetical protein [Streptomyces lunaelactis]NUK25274.1 hypothetical protein [Streptomyces lunaelactis]NUK37186.1 hypothetical protein [Streptomyces lunaelactis]NUK43457.1 hypothetical protein [Streptomyces lunaelactis]NUK76502.1 hypothetical protein [Streptomyces lunaelactis]NUK94111.1 hypothetical protein [Streptomyces lunaelactis]